MKPPAGVLRAALEYQALGWPVFPVRGKDPATGHGFKDATLDPDQARRWWRPGSRLGVALATGRPSGVWILDIDGPEGEDSLGVLELEHGELPATVEALTGRGRHLYFRMPEGVDIRNSAGKVGPGLDVRGTGGYVVLPPSPHPDGGFYRWAEGRAPELVPVADPPRLARPAPPPPPPPSLQERERARPAPRGRYVEAAIERECSALARTPEGQRNEALNRAAFALGRFISSGEADPRTVARALAYAAARAGLEPRETERTLQSAFRARGL